MKRREIICIGYFKNDTLEKLKENGYILNSGNVFIPRDEYNNIFKWDKRNHNNLLYSYFKVIESVFDNKPLRIDKDHLIILSALKVIEIKYDPLENLIFFY